LRIVRTQWRRELEEVFNNLDDVRQERVRTIQDLADEYLISYKCILCKFGDKILVDINEETVKEYQEGRSVRRPSRNRSMRKSVYSSV